MTTFRSVPRARTRGDVKSGTNGAVLYRGPSLIDGAPIVVIATGLRGKSRNPKTGKMVQTWVMRSDVAPHVAVKTGQDSSVCGDCDFRPIHAKARDKRKPCYVRTWQAPRSVYDSFQRGIYPEMSPATARAALRGKKLRLGAYGNPSAAPFDLWAEWSAETIGHTGYLHNWKTADSRWNQLCMASVESVKDGIEARKRGYRLFRVRSHGTKLAGEANCPASKESGHKTTCFDCIACGGLSSKAKADITILMH